MTIILQNDFEQLNIKDDHFEVLLRLRGIGNASPCPSMLSRHSRDKSELKCSDK